MDDPRFEFPRELSAELRIDLRRDPSPAAKLHGPDDMLTEHARRSVLALGEIETRRDRLGANDRDACEAGSQHDRLAREHPDRGHEPAVWTRRLVEEPFEFVGVDLVVPASADADGEAMYRRVGDQEASPSQKEERSHGSLIGQGNQTLFESLAPIVRGAPAQLRGQR